MACMKLGSKADVFLLKGQSWTCTSSLSSDVCIKVGDTSFHLHKFPLLSRSRLFEKLIQEFSSSQKIEGECIVFSLHDLPGGAKSFLLVAKFCYDIKFEVTAANAVGLRCAAEYLQMTEDQGDGNLISLMENFLGEVFKSWGDTIKALENCQEMLPYSEKLYIISRCIDSLSAQACAIHEDWWYDDVSVLELPLFKRLILAVCCTGKKPDRIAGALMCYAKKYLPLNSRQSSFQLRKSMSRMVSLSDEDQRVLIEDIVSLLPNQKCAMPISFLLKLLRTSLILHASRSCLDSLEIRIGTQLHEAVLQDLLIPNTSYSVDTLYDTECIQRIVNHFLVVEQNDTDANLKSVIENGLADGPSVALPINMVANLLDDYLAEVAADVNLNLEKFLSLAYAIPDSARPLDDGMYRAIDIYLKAHPWLTDSEKEKLCRLMSCQRLSLEASSHAAQNQRLPLRFIVQVLFFEQLRLRTSVAGCFFISDNMDNSQNVTAPRNDGAICEEGGRVFKLDDIKERVSELEKECEDMKYEIEKIVKKKGNWNNLFKRFGFKFKTSSAEVKGPTVPGNGEALQLLRKDVLNRKQERKIKLAD